MPKRKDNSISIRISTSEKEELMKYAKMDHKDLSKWLLTLAHNRIKYLNYQSNHVTQVINGKLYN